jgi:hypothetical protein
MIKQLKQIFNSIEFIENYIEESKLRKKELDKRFNNVLKASLNGSKPWFIELARKDPDCAIDILKECDIDDSEKSL